MLGTFVTMSVYGHDPAKVNKAIDNAFAEIEQVDQLMSIHQPDSELSKVNSTADHEQVAISKNLFEVIKTSVDIGRQTEGAFDITIRPLAQLWGFIWKEYRLPTQSELDQVLPLVNFRALELDAAKQTIRFAKPGISIDLGGIGKGYAVDLAIERLQREGISRAMVKAGGDLRVIGAPPGQNAWLVQIEDPAKQGNRTAVSLKDRALSTSGNYENFFEINGKRYSHILNPKTGLPINGVASCTVIAPTCAESDAWATALFVYGPERSLQKFGSKFPIRFLVENSTADTFSLKESATFKAAKEPTLP